MRLFRHELRYELLLYSRSRELAFFTFLLPMILFLLLGFAYGDEEIQGVKGSDYLLTGTLGYGVVATAFAGLAIVLVIRREDGILKRLRSTPLPAPTYLVAVLATTMVAFLIQAVCIVAVGMAAFGASFPSHLVSFVLALILGAASFAALGVGLTGLIKQAEGASAVVNAIYFPMLFISGAFFERDTFPEFLQAIADRAAAHVLHRARLRSRVRGRPDLGSPGRRRRPRRLGARRRLVRGPQSSGGLRARVSFLQSGNPEGQWGSRAGDRLRDEDLRTASPRDSGQLRHVRGTRGDAG